MRLYKSGIETTAEFSTLEKRMRKDGQFEPTHDKAFMAARNRLDEANATGEAVPSNFSHAAYFLGRADPHRG